MPIYTTPYLLPPDNIPNKINTHLTFSLHYPLLSKICYSIFILLILLQFYIIGLIVLIGIIFLQFFYRLPIYDKSNSNYLINTDQSFIHTIKSPSFGTVLDIQEYDDHYRIITYLSVTDVHYQYFPITGQVIKRKYKNGTYYPAHLLEKTQYNERCHTIIEHSAGYYIEVIQIAGVLARRIDTFYEIGKDYKQGDLLGIIHFGSRVDTILPKKIGNNWLKIVVIKGQQLIGGQTVIAISDGFLRR